MVFWPVNAFQWFHRLPKVIVWKLPFKIVHNCLKKLFAVDLGISLTKLNVIECVFLHLFLDFLSRDLPGLSRLHKAWRYKILEFTAAYDSDTDISRRCMSKDKPWSSRNTSFVLARSVISPVFFQMLYEPNVFWLLFVATRLVFRCGMEMLAECCKTMPNCLHSSEAACNPSDGEDRCDLLQGFLHPWCCHFKLSLVFVTLMVQCLQLCRECFEMFSTGHSF